mgnify:CR=1 FL=1
MRYGGAERRGFPIVDAPFPTEPTFVLRPDSKYLEDALDLAQRMLTPLRSGRSRRDFLACPQEGVR